MPRPARRPGSATSSAPWCSGSPARRRSVVLDPGEFLRIAADRTRLAVLGRLAVGAARAAQVSADCGLNSREAARVLGRLTASGLVHEEGGGYALDDAVLRALAAA